MSIASALAFLRSVRESDDMRAALASHKGDLVAFALGEGYEFTDSELDRAFRIDWTARSLHYTRAALAAGAKHDA